MNLSKSLGISISANFLFSIPLDSKPNFTAKKAKLSEKSWSEFSLTTIVISAGLTFCIKYSFKKDFCSSRT